MIAVKQRHTSEARSLGTTALLLTATLCLPLGAATAATTATTGKSKSTHEKIVVQSDASGERLRAGNLNSFTPPVFDSKFSFTAPGKSAANARQQTIENAYNFTPSGRNSRKALTLGVTSRVMANVADTSRAAAPSEFLVTTPSGYGVDLAVGYKGFAVSGGYSRVDAVAPASLNPQRREAVDVGLSYRFKSWKTSFQLGAESGGQLPLSPLANAAERRYSAEVGAAYAVSPRLSVTGGV